MAVEFADAPRQIEDMGASYARFKRLSILQVIRAFDETHNLFARLIAGHALRDALEQRMGYWEQEIPSGQQCFVHHTIGREDVIVSTFDRLKGDGGFVLLGTYHVEPQSSAYPFSFPFGDTLDHWHAEEPFRLTDQSISGSTSSRNSLTCSRKPSRCGRCSRRCS